MKIFDTHAHYNDKQYDEDREELLKKMYIEGVDKITLVGASLNDSISEKKLADDYYDRKDVPKLYYTVGDHPDEIILESPNSEKGIEHLQKLEEICKSSDGKDAAVAIGEIGLDYYGENKTEEIYKHQKEWFIAEIELAKKLNLPIVVHSRDACKDTLDIIEQYAKGMKGVIHCFAYDKEIAEKYVKMGFFIGIGGVLTFKNAKKIKEAMEKTPIERIVTETDCPYLAPTPYRGTRNESTYIKLVIEEMSKIKNINMEKIEEMVYNNAVNLYG